MLDALPPSPPAIIVEAASDHRPYLMLGFVATGPSAALCCIEKLSEGPGLTHDRTDGPNAAPEVMVGFLPGGSQTSQLRAYQAGRSGTCSGAKIEVTLLPVAALQNGKGLEEATIEDPSFIVEPKL